MLVMIIRMIDDYQILQVGGPYWDVPVGKKDSKSASLTLAETNLPSANQDLVTLISKFLYQGLSVTDMVALVGKITSLSC